eukprot:67051-Chlamydomonas_euryale.AAC.7
MGGGCSGGCVIAAAGCATAAGGAWVLQLGCACGCTGCGRLPCADAREIVARPSIFAAESEWRSGGWGASWDNDKIGWEGPAVCKVKEAGRRRG